MSDVSPNSEREKLEAGISYLREHAIEAHRAGDGMQVQLLATNAIRKYENVGKRVLNFSAFTWAFTLGMYWMVQDWFLDLVKSALKDESDGSDSSDKGIVVLIFKLLHKPGEKTDLVGVYNLLAEWLDERFCADAESREEDRITLIFLLELTWYSDPQSSDWLKSVDSWLEHLSPQSDVRERVIETRNRLQFQSAMYTGESFDPANAGNLPINDSIQQDLFKGWIAYYNCNWTELDKLLKDLRHRVGVGSNDFRPFFNLIHVARIHSTSKEDQLVSLARRWVNDTRDPASAFEEFRDSRFYKDYSDIAAAFFPDSSMQDKRESCLRMAMLMKLDALRKWDVGGWWWGLQNSARIHQELGAAGDLESAVKCVRESIRGHRVPDPENSPQFEKCLLALEKLEATSRIEFCRALLKAPPIEWRYAHSILCEMSDAIPEEILPELVDWSLKVESIDLSNRLWVHTFLYVWDDILPHALQREKLIQNLAPALSLVITKSKCWDLAGETIYHSMVFGPANLAIELAELLATANAKQPHQEEHRFKIAYNVLNERPELGEILLPLVEKIASIHDEIGKTQLLKGLRRGEKEPNSKNDPVYKRKLKANIKQRIEERRDLKGPSISLGRSSFFGLSKLVSWRRAEKDLVQVLVETIDSETILYNDKDDYIALLGKLVREGPKTQARVIAAHALRWLNDGIVGRSIAGDSPWGIARVFLPSDSFKQLKNYLFFLVEQCSLKCPEIILEPFVSWLSANMNDVLPKHSYHLLRTIFSLLSSIAEGSAELAAIVCGISETASVVSLDHNAENVVKSFSGIVLDECVENFARGEVANERWIQFFFEQWMNRLGVLSQHPSAEVRKQVALAVNLWNTSDLKNRERLEIIHSRLKKDCRLRVRRVVADGKSSA